MNEGNKVAGVA